MAHPNEDLLHRYFEAAARGDLDTLDKVFADDVVGHIAGGHELAGDYRGKEGVFGFFGQLAERSAGTAELRLRDVLVDDWFAVALIDAVGRVGDAEIGGDPGVVVFRVADGQVIEWWSHHYDQPKMDRIWANS